MKVVNNTSTIMSYNDFPEDICILAHTTKCNLKCHYCFNMKTIQNTPKNQLIDFKDYVEYAIQKYTKAFKSSFPKNICITGGEPTIDYLILKDHLKWLKSNGFKIKLDTNGTNYLIFLFNPSNEDHIFYYINYLGLDIKIPFVDLEYEDDDNLSSLNQRFTKYISKHIAMEQYLTGINLILDNIFKFNTFNHSIRRDDMGFIDFSSAHFTYPILRTTISKVLFPTLNDISSHLININDYIKELVQRYDQDHDFINTFYPITIELKEAKCLDSCYDTNREHYILDYDIEDIIKELKLHTLEYLNIKIQK